MDNMINSAVNYSYQRRSLVDVRTKFSLIFVQRHLWHASS